MGTRKGHGVPSSIPDTHGDGPPRGHRLNPVERGYLLLADIGGYTHYLSGVELEHSTDILADLLGIVLEQLRGTFVVDKVEGDAVFCHGPDSSVSGGAVNASVEACYFAFAGRLQAIARATTCPCRACRQVPSLSLKFVVHNGEYARQRVDRREELVGPEVIVAHRLLKNAVTNQTGLNGYALFTDACIERMRLDAAPAGMRGHAEWVEEIGQVNGQVFDLEARWQEEQARRVVYVGPEEADFAFEVETSVPPPVTWEYFTSPTKTLLWLADSEEHENPRGVQGVGTINHCAHGKLVNAPGWPRRSSWIWTNEILDWKPYRYQSYRTQDHVFGRFLSTDEITPLEGGTRWRLSRRTKGVSGRWQRMLIRLFSRNQRAMFDLMGERLRQVLADKEPKYVETTKRGKASAHVTGTGSAGFERKRPRRPTGDTEGHKTPSRK